MRRDASYLPERTKAEREGQGATESNDPPYAAVLLRKEVNLPKQPVRATAYVSGLGYYELSLNGKKVGDHVLDPGFTDYTKRVLYVTYDVTNMLKAGRGAMGVILGGGWYNSPALDVWGFEPNRPGMLRPSCSCNSRSNTATVPARPSSPTAPGSTQPDRSCSTAFAAARPMTQGGKNLAGTSPVTTTPPGPRPRWRPRRRDA